MISLGRGGGRLGYKLSSLLGCPQRMRLKRPETIYMTIPW